MKVSEAEHNFTKDSTIFFSLVVSEFLKLRLRPHEDDHRLRSVFKFIHFGVRFRIYAFTVSVFIVFVWTEGLNA